ncbi:MAG: hypothetical protein Tsb005_21250 [Gammaproteobacteria bacterium]
MDINYNFKKRIISGFDTWSDTYSSDVSPKLQRRGYSYEGLAYKILEYINPEPNSIVAEFGTGTGILGMAIKSIRPDLKIIGFDISSKMLRNSQKTSAYEVLFQCDSEIIPIINNRFQFIYTAFMFHSILNPIKCLAELKRVSIEGSRIAIVDLFRSRKRIPYLSRIAENIHSYKYEHGAPSRYHSVKELIKLISSSNIMLSSSIRLDKNSKIEEQAAGGMVHHLLGLTV